MHRVKSPTSVRCCIVVSKNQAHDISVGVGERDWISNRCTVLVVRPVCVIAMGPQPDHFNKPNRLAR